MPYQFSHMCTHAHTCLCTCLCTDTHACMHMHARVHTHIFTQYWLFTSSHPSFPSPNIRLYHLYIRKFMWYIKYPYSCSLFLHNFPVFFTLSLPGDLPNVTCNQSPALMSSGRQKIWATLPYIHTYPSLLYLDQTRPIPLPFSGSTFSSLGPTHSSFFFSPT